MRVCVSSITVNSSLNLPKFDHYKFLLEFIGVVVVVVVVVLHVCSITVNSSLDLPLF